MTSVSDLEIFARVARTGNMSAAGREMGLSPAVVSKRMSLLEDSLKTRLFQRTTRQLKLTEPGLGFFKRIVDVLALLDEARDFVDLHTDRVSGLVRVTAPTGFGRMQIVPQLPTLLEQHPTLEVELHLSDTIVDIIGEGYDIAFRVSGKPESSLHVEEIAPLDRVLCAAASYLDEQGTPASLEDLELHQCIAAGSQDVWSLERSGRKRDFRPRSRLRTNSSDCAQDAVRAGLGIALLPAWEIASDLTSGRLRQVLPGWQGAESTALLAILPTREHRNRRVQVLIEHVAAACRTSLAWRSANQAA